MKYRQLLIGFLCQIVCKIITISGKWHVKLLIS